MAIPYSKLDDVRIQAGTGVSIAAVNGSLARLLSNDVSMAYGTGVQPAVWEQKWYGSGDTSQYYSKGDAVWINTEDPDTFVRSREQDIIRYAQYDQQLATAFAALSSDQDSEERIELCKKFAFGEYDRKRGPIFWLGDLTQCAQIRVSLSDSNDKTPDNNDWWEDFFVRFTESDIRLSILDEYRAALSAVFAAHLSGYHLSGFSLDGSPFQSEQSFRKACLLADMSNVSGVQSYQGRGDYWSKSEGFDHVKAFRVAKFGASRKWYRVWASGLIEHGGIVDASDPTASQDSRSGNLFNVRFDWELSGSSAPVYDYQPSGFDKFYGYDEKYWDGQTSAFIPNTDVGSGSRYTVVVSRVVGSESAVPYVFDGEYDTVDTCFFDNSGFSFLVTGDPVHQMFSYYARGYSGQSRKY